MCVFVLESTCRVGWEGSEGSFQMLVPFVQVTKAGPLTSATLQTSLECLVVLASAFLLT